MKPAPFRCETPATIAEAVSLLATYGEEAKVLAGGQSLGPLLNLRMSTPSVLVDLRAITGLRGVVRLESGAIRIGSMTTYQELLDSRVCHDWLPLLAAAIPFVGHQAIRNVGTIGGSVAHADPAAEMPAALVALGARVGLASRAGERVVDAADFFTGIFSSVLEDGEIVVWIECPDMGQHTAAWHEVAPRHGDYAVVGAGAVLAQGNGLITGARLALVGVADVPFLCQETRRLLGVSVSEAVASIDELALAISGEVDPRGDLVSSAAYKRHLVQLLSGRALRQCLSGLARHDGQPAAVPWRQGAADE
ncbi:MAG: carbon monoxide dehydrogenase medium chain [Marmoricola sp.]|nr:carbon monoxide dehydrogenase medium chain [Marmoricola sp.]